MIRKLFLCFVLCLSALMVNAADDARATLDKVAAKINLKKGATANFTISGGKFGSQSGTIAIKGNKFNAHTAQTIVWYDGKTQWFYSVKNQEVNVSTPSAKQQQIMNPYHFLTLYKQGYNITQQKTASGKQFHLVGKGKNISEAYILVDAQNTLKQVKMKQGTQWITINVSNFKSQTLSDSAFRFNAKDYPKAEVIDLR